MGSVTFGLDAMGCHRRPCEAMGSVTFGSDTTIGTDGFGKFWVGYYHWDGDNFSASHYFPSALTGKVRTLEAADA